MTSPEAVAARAEVNKSAWDNAWLEVDVLGLLTGNALGLDDDVILVDWDHGLTTKDGCVGDACIRRRVAPRWLLAEATP